MVFKTSEIGRRIDNKSAIKLDIPPGYKNLSKFLKIDSIDVKNVADLFLKNLDGAAKSKLGVKYAADGQEIIYLLDSEDNIIRKLQKNVSGTLIEYKWRGVYRERLQYASKNNAFNPPGFSAVEVKNRYH